MNPQPEIRLFGKNTLLICWEEEISQNIQKEILSVDYHINSSFKHAITETTISYQSIAVYINSEIDPHVFKLELTAYLKSLELKDFSSQGNVFYIPVCYHSDFGFDLKALSEYHHLTKKGIIAQHTEPVYPIYFIGFLPGFPYLGGLHPMLSTPRQSKPRPNIPSGSVGIAGNQTGIYPAQSPGGWNIIGRTPVKIFDSKMDNPSLFRAGDFIKFEAVTKNEYHAIEEEVKSNRYQLKIEKKS